LSAVTGTIQPSFDEFVGLAQRGNVVPVTCEILGDLETPVSAFLKLHRGRHGFLLESVQGGEK
jgi:anthranilate synthase component 1